MELRDFIYLDISLVQGFLSQLEGGLAGDSIERQRVSGTSELGGAVGIAGASFKGGKSGESTIETETPVRQVATSEFQRLYDHLCNHNLLTVEEVDDIEFVTGLRRRQVLEAEAELEPSGTDEIGSLASRVAELGDLVSKFGVDSSLDQEAEEGARTVGGIAASRETAAALGQLVGTAHVPISMSLKKEYLLKSDWYGEATILVRILRVLK